MTFPAFVGKLLGLLHVELERPPNPYDDLYSDLALDSLQAFELTIIVESLADCMLLPELPPELFTLGDAYAYFLELKSAND